MAGRVLEDARRVFERAVLRDDGALDERALRRALYDRMGRDARRFAFDFVRFWDEAVEELGLLNEKGFRESGYESLLDGWDERLVRRTKKKDRKRARHRERRRAKRGRSSSSSGDPEEARLERHRRRKTDDSSSSEPGSVGGRRPRVDREKRVESGRASSVRARGDDSDDSAYRAAYAQHMQRLSRGSREDPSTARASHADRVAPLARSPFEEMGSKTQNKVATGGQRNDPSEREIDHQKKRRRNPERDSAADVQKNSWMPPPQPPPPSDPPPPLTHKAAHEHNATQMTRQDSVDREAERRRVRDQLLEQVKRKRHQQELRDQALASLKSQRSVSPTAAGTSAVLQTEHLSETRAFLEPSNQQPSTENGETQGHAESSSRSPQAARGALDGSALRIKVLAVDAEPSEDQETKSPNAGDTKVENAAKTTKVEASHPRCNDVAQNADDTGSLSTDAAASPRAADKDRNETKSGKTSVSSAGDIECAGANTAADAGAKS